MPGLYTDCHTKNFSLTAFNLSGVIANVFFVQFSPSSELYTAFSLPSIAKNSPLANTIEVSLGFPAFFEIDQSTPFDDVDIPPWPTATKTLLPNATLLKFPADVEL
ncbi:hypothetical protein D3C76_1222520 [compost metagenome]